jgi:protein ImuB
MRPVIFVALPISSVIAWALRSDRGFWSGTVTDKPSKDLEHVLTAKPLHTLAGHALARRYLAVWFPFLPADRIRRETRQKKDAPANFPLVIVEKAKSALRIVAVDSHAVSLRLTPSMTLADARAQVPELDVVQADAKADSRLLDQLAAACDRFTPLVSLSVPDAVVLDITGCTHLFGSETKLLQAVSARLSAFHVTLKASIANTPDAALAFVRHSRQKIIPSGKTKDYAGKLLVKALHAAPEVTVALNRAGLKTIGDLMARPTAMLSARFGEDLTRKVQRVAGMEDIRLTPLRPLPQCMVEQLFAEPLLHQDAIDTQLRCLIAAAAQQLEARGSGGRRFEARFYRVDGRVALIAVDTSFATRDAKLLMRLFAEKFDSLADPLDPGFGFDAMRLSVPVIEAVAPQQVTSDLAGYQQTDQAEARLHELVDTLAIRFGPENVQRFAAEDRHIPERASRHVSATAKQAHAVVWPEPVADEPPLRPLQLFHPPQPIETLAEVPDGPPIRFRWRRVLHQVTKAEGPERFAPEWWREKPAEQTRDYYRIEDSSGFRFWVFREGFYGDAVQPPRWFMHGLFA